MQTHEALWRAIEAFDIDGGKSEFPFAFRLARENGWTPAFAKRVAFEYKRFLFLSQVAGHPVTPSDEVDQSWHLHMVYTRSYWDRLCREVLQRPLHHDPTRGGQAEGAKFEDWYTRTLESYQRLFGETPPRDIWPANEERFARAVQFKRVNVCESLIIPKARVRKALATAAIGGAACALAGCAMTIANNSSSDTWFILGAIAIGSIVMILVAVVSRHGQKNDGRGGSGCGNGGGGIGGCGGSGCAHDSGGSGCSNGCGGSGCGGGGCGGGGD